MTTCVPPSDVIQWPRIHASGLGSQAPPFYEKHSTRWVWKSDGEV